jgi:uncharacterized phage-associated protein
MTVSAHDVAAVLRERLPDIKVKKLHKLLYYCQGHHLAQVDKPLFSEPISAWDMGPVVGRLWHQENEGETVPPRRELNEAELNTIGYVLSRYGALTGKDLENLTHGEAPWKLANNDREPRGSATIRLDWMKYFFQTEGAPGDDDDEPLDTADVRRWLAETTSQSPGPSRPDDLDRLRARMTRSA